jgi:putative tricarboxylic transport membrane protein
MRSADAISALVMLVLSAVVLVATRQLPYWSDFAPGSAFAPTWVAVAGIAASLVLLVGTLRRRTSPPVDWPDRAGILRVILAAVALWAVVALAPVLGLVPTIVLFMLFLLLAVARRRLLPSLLTTAVTTALVYGVFVAWLGIAFPKGPLGL